MQTEDKFCLIKWPIDRNGLIFGIGNALGTHLGALKKKRNYSPKRQHL